MSKNIDKIEGQLELAKELVAAMQSGEKFENSSALSSITKDDERLSELLTNIETNKELKVKLIEKYTNIDLDKNLSVFKQHIKHKKNIKLKRAFVRVSTIGIAAAMIAISLFVWDGKNDKKTDIIAEDTRVSSQHLQPIIIFSDSEELRLSEGETASIEEISKRRKGVSKSKMSSSEVETVRLITPAQVNQRVTLEDGTIVILNSQSELSFPSKFIGDNRVVALKGGGEAYFKVAKSTKPFLVNVNGAKIKVFGTEFNISNRDASKVETVLVEGSVAVGVGEEMTMMKPNQLAVVDTKSSNVDIKSVNISGYIAWIDGYFEFIDTDFNTVIREFKDWYGVELHYDADEFKGVKLNVSFKKSGSIIDALNKINTAIDISITQKNDAYEIKKSN